MLTYDPTKAPRAELEIAKRRLDDFKAKEADLAQMGAGETSFDALMSHDMALEAVRKSIVIAAQAVQFKKAELEAALAEVVEKELDAEHRAAVRAAESGKKLLRQFEKWVAEGPSILAAIEENRARIDAVNEQRGSRPFIVDAERAVRERPGKQFPATTTNSFEWVDAQGNPVPDQICKEGKWFHNPAAVERKWVDRVVMEAHQGGAEMPERLADAVRLVDLNGTQLWPPVPTCARLMGE